MEQSAHFPSHLFQLRSRRVKAVPEPVWALGIRKGIIMPYRPPLKIGITLVFGLLILHEELVIVIFKGVNVLLRGRVLDLNVWKLFPPLLHHHVHHKVVVLSVHESKVTPESKVNVVHSFE